jgi:hypothetical protein
VPVHERCHDLLHPFHADALVLVLRKKMIRGLQLHERPKTTAPEVHGGPEVQRSETSANMGGELVKTDRQ